MPVAHLVRFISKYSYLYQCFNEDAQLKIGHCIEEHSVGKIMGWFIKNSLTEHGNDIEIWIRSEEHPDFTTEQFDALLKISDTEEWENQVCKLVSIYYKVSYSFDQADSRFQVAIPKYIELFNNESIIYLVQEIEENDQCWARGKARQDYELIKKRINELFDNEFNYEQTPNFKRIIDDVE